MTRFTEPLTEQVVNGSRPSRGRADLDLDLDQKQRSSAVDVSGELANGRRGDQEISRLDDRQRLQATAARLRVDLPNIDKLLRLGAVAMVERCEAFCAQRPDVGPGYLAQLILQGGPSVEPRRRGAVSPVIPAAQSCPLDPEQRGALAEQWCEIEARIRLRLGHDAAALWDTWMGKAHAHRVADDVELGVSAVASGWIARRYGRLVEGIAGRPVVYVACEVAS